MTKISNGASFSKIKSIGIFDHTYLRHKKVIFPVFFVPPRGASCMGNWVGISIGVTSNQTIFDVAPSHAVCTWKLKIHKTYKYLGDTEFFRLQGIKVLKATVSGVFEDLKFKISEGSDKNWSCPVLKYPRNCRLHATLIQKVLKKSWIG